MTKPQQALTAILALQLVLGVVVFWPRPEPAAAASLLGAIEADDITSLAIRDDKGASIELARRPALSASSTVTEAQAGQTPSASTTEPAAQAQTGQGKWVLPEASDYPADSTKITPLLAKLVALRSNRLATKTQASHARLRVADDNYLRRLDIRTSGGASQTLFLGSSAGGSTTHVRVAGQNEVYLAGDLATWEVNTDVTSWIDTTYVTVPQADVVAVTLGNANGQWTFEKDDQGNWTMQGLAPDETLNTNSVTGLLSRVTSVRMTRPLGTTEQPGYGLSQPSAMVTLKTERDNQEKTTTLMIGAKDSTDNTYVVKSSESTYYVRVAEYTVKDLIEKQRDGFLQLPPTPAPAPAPGATPTPAP